MTYLTQLGAQLGVWLYVLAAALAFAESALLLGMVLPGETALLVAGYFSHQGVLSLSVMVPLAVLAAVAGDSVGFEVGRRYGPRLRGSQVGRRVGDRRWSTVDRFLLRHGGKAVLFARMTAVLRAVTPTAAGMSGMHYRTFLVWNAVGGLIWGGGCVLLGWAFASALARVGHYLSWGPLTALASVGLAAAGVRRCSSRSRSARGQSDAHAERPLSRA